MKIKLCGLRRIQDIAAVNAFPPDYAGFVFAPSRRQVSPQDAAALTARLHPAILPVGVFVDEPLDSLEQAVQTANLAVIQLHGGETEEYIRQVRVRCPGKEIWKAVRVQDQNSILQALRLGIDKLLLDSFSPHLAGGTGQTADWQKIAQTSIPIPFLLAGGLDETNLEQAIKQVSPWGVDLSSGVETDGAKDPEKIRRIIQLIRAL